MEPRFARPPAELLADLRDAIEAILGRQTWAPFLPAVRVNILRGVYAWAGDVVAQMQRNETEEIDRERELLAAWLRERASE
jgi:hypothetical protein